MPAGEHHIAVPVFLAGRSQGSSQIGSLVIASHHAGSILATFRHICTSPPFVVGQFMHRAEAYKTVTGQYSRRLIVLIKSVVLGSL
jgi:hypothetical protein